MQAVSHFFGNLLRILSKMVFSNSKCTVSFFLVLAPNVGRKIVNTVRKVLPKQKYVY